MSREKEDILKNRKRTLLMVDPIVRIPIEFKETLCQTCSKGSNLFCTCNVSKQALNKLYSGFFGYNITFLNCINESSPSSLLIMPGTNESSKTFEIL